MTSLWAKLPGGLEVHRTQPEHAQRLEQLQIAVFPTLADDERFKAQHYLHHIAQFADGQFCALHGEHVVGMTSTIRLPFDFDHVAHTFAEVIGGGWMSIHDPQGAWMYGADIGVHPDFRGRGIARALYAARQDAVRRLGLAGQVTVGMPSGYGTVKHAMTAEAYYAELLSGERSDPTISAQLAIGFVPRALIPGYINDPVCDGYGVLLVLAADREIPFRREP